MKRHITLLVSLFFLMITVVSAQSNFSYMPQNPKAGDLITFSYEPAGVLNGITTMIDAVQYQKGTKVITEDIVLTRIGRKLTGSVQTDSASGLLFFGFSIDKTFDNNFNNGYYILLKDVHGTIKQGAHGQLGLFYQINPVGVDPHPAKALASITKEMEMFPSERNKYLPSYLRLVSHVQEETAAATMQKEIESFLKKGLNTEDDYQLVENMYTIAKLTEQASFIARIKKQEYPNGKWTISDYLTKFFAEKDPGKAKEMTAYVLNKIKTDPQWKPHTSSLDYWTTRPLAVYQLNKDWEGFKEELSRLKQDVFTIMFSNSVANELQKISVRLDLAEQLSKAATDWARTELTRPTQIKLMSLSSKEWNKVRQSTFAKYANTYALVLYRKGEYKKAMVLIKEVIAADSKNTLDFYNTYALIAEKVLPKKQYKKVLEDFIKKDGGTNVMADGLKKIYMKERGSETGFAEYVAALKKESYMKMLDQMRKQMLNNTSPIFTLKNVNGKHVNFNDLKGKIVIVDFWATWCAPCKASFPAMQKMVTKYKDNPNVEFIFIDTYERSDTKEKNAADFMAENKYTFQVLMDNEDKVVTQFKVEGLPTKFVIDKLGNIRFKSVGYHANEEKFITELDAMILLAGEPAQVTVAPKNGL